jgi:hypothetical protein
MIETHILTNMDAAPLFAVPWPYQRYVKLYCAGEDVVDTVYNGNNKTSKKIYTVPEGKLLVITLMPTMWHDPEAELDGGGRYLNGDDLVCDMLKKHGHPVGKVKLRYL